MEKKELVVNKQSLRVLNIWKVCLMFLAVLFTFLGLVLIIGAVIGPVPLNGPYIFSSTLFLFGLLLISSGVVCFSLCATMNALKTITEVFEYKKAMIESEFEIKSLDQKKLKIKNG